MNSALSNHTHDSTAESAAKALAEQIVSARARNQDAEKEQQDLLERFLVCIMSLAGAQAGAVRLLSDDGKYMKLVSQIGMPPHIASAELLVDRGCGVCGAACDGDVLAWLDDVNACARGGTLTAAPTASWFGLQCQSILAISLVHNGQALGVYNLFFHRKPQIDQPTQTMLRLIGQLLGLSLHNAMIERERLRTIVMRERQEMVNEVHDAIAQTLAYVRMRLPLLNDAMLAHDDTSSLKYFANIKAAVTEVHDNLREVMTYFRTRMDPLGLLHALKGVAAEFFGRTGIVLELQNSVQNLHLSDEEEVQIFHIIQECLSNIAKHSMASHAVVSISKVPGHLEFLVEDDGLGMDEPNVSTIVTAAREMVPSTHLGLEIMQSRAKRLGGSLDVSKNGATGTRIRLLLPIMGNDSPEADQ